MKIEEGQNKDEIRRRCPRNRKTREKKEKQEQQKQNLTKKSENFQGQCQMRRKEGGVMSMDVVILIETQKKTRYSAECRDGLRWVW